MDGCDDGHAEAERANVFHHEVHDEAVAALRKREKEEIELKPSFFVRTTTKWTDGLPSVRRPPTAFWICSSHLAAES